MPGRPRPRLRLQGWDPLLLLSQIIILQTLHYLTLALLLPPLLSLLTDSEYLQYLGGRGTVGMVLDWREMAGRREAGMGEWGNWGAGRGNQDWARAVDPRRGWVIGVGWLLGACVNITYLYYVIRRPTYILDFSLTLIFVHILITTSYSHSLPLSLFFWLVMGICAAVMVVFPEQLCVRRELREGIGSVAQQQQDEDQERIELGNVGAVSID
ncbi:hypothetical protein DACRYDRAFT_115188 [Dacryopinax primogenitus]|uniref:Uncharacterized protein n=1 Tax=Dacryopinax primogenitus (strain DJM 731) TaxID=1858805 RepID=M5G5C8_DACPD|nr:uncharacterized protein DACRYDRAFT_115188 [Dacryopinax primogenitus]EJU03884.1 hypothetical protein DACRYDRAFT_115188 [Dacryopinax primogenitus]